MFNTRLPLRRGNLPNITLVLFNGFSLTRSEKYLKVDSHLKKENHTDEVLTALWRSLATYIIIDTASGKLSTSTCASTFNN